MVGSDEDLGCGMILGIFKALGETTINIDGVLWTGCSGWKK
jgi:hypothetical protein